jgi:hypothetical protein
LWLFFADFRRPTITFRRRDAPDALDEEARHLETM